MRKLLLTNGLMLLLTTTHAGHLYGGELTARQISSLVYQINLTLYTDSSSPSISSVDRIISYYNLNTEIGSSTTIAFTGTSYYNNFLAQFNFTDTIIFPEAGFYRIAYDECCRIGLISNATNAGAEYLHIIAYLNVDTGFLNSSPILLNTPIYIGQIGDTLIYNPVPFDIDGDSLVWSIDTPLVGIINSNNFYMYLPGYTTPYSYLGGEFSIDIENAEVTWIPISQGGFVTRIKVEEFRNGFKIGEINRDMCFLIYPNINNNPQPFINTTSWLLNSNNNFQFNLAVNIPFNLDVNAIDLNGSPLLVWSIGEPIIQSISPSSFFNSTSGNGYSNNSFTWTPNINQVRTMPYIAAFRIRENNGYFVRDYTILLKVTNLIGMEEPTHEPLDNIYPNPSTRELFISLNVEKSSELKLIFINQLGQEVKKVDKKINTGQNLIYLNDLNLSEGIYFLNIMIDGKEQVKKLVVKK